jgi:hypothetical protein
MLIGTIKKNPPRQKFRLCETESIGERDKMSGSFKPSQSGYHPGAN